MEVYHFQSKQYPGPADINPFKLAASTSTNPSNLVLTYGWMADLAVNRVSVKSVCW